MVMGVVNHSSGMPIHEHLEVGIDMNWHWRRCAGRGLHSAVLAMMVMLMVVLVLLVLHEIRLRLALVMMDVMRDRVTGL